MKRTLSFLLCILLLGSLILPAFAADESLIDTAIRETAQYLTETVPAPTLGSIGGEWAVLGLARSGIEVPDGYFTRYIERVENTVQSQNGVLHTQKYTEYSRVILALSAIGADPRSVAGYDLTAPLGDFQKTIYQGINGAAFALIALDSKNYSLPADATATREQYLLTLLNAQLPDGGWALTGEVSEPDMTAMVLTSLAPYREREDVKPAIDRALRSLSEMQSETGGFPSYGDESAESTAQVLVALCSLGISPDDPRFVKSGHSVTDHLMTFFVSGGGFRHLAGDDAPNLMASEQCFYALAAYRRFLQGKTALYDMSDVPFRTTAAFEGLSGKHPDVSKMSVAFPGKTFSDTVGHPNQTAIEALASRGIINGKSDSLFDPDSTMTRAEFATIVVRALGLAQKDGDVFKDISENDWFYSYVNTAYAYGIVKGVSDTAFLPGGTITREEAAVMVGRAAHLAGMDTSVASPIDTLCAFLDYRSVSDWAQDSLAFCYREGILSDDAMEILPKEAILRSEIAQMLYNMLRSSKLL